MMGLTSIDFLLTGTTIPLKRVATHKLQLLPYNGTAGRDADSPCLSSLTKGEANRSPQNSDRALLAQVLGTGIAVTAESFVSLMLTNRRFHQQINTINGSTGRLSVGDHFRCIQFFTPARLIQFSVLLGGKSVGINAYDSLTGTSDTTASKIVGGLFSTVLGLPFAAPMENVLVQGITAASKGQPFNLKPVLIDTAYAIQSGRFRALGATMYREAPYGFCLSTLPSFFSDRFKSLGASQSVSDLLASMCSSGFYTIVSHPFDLIKTGIQNRPDLPDRTFAVGRQIVAERGLKALSSGFLMRLSKVFGTFLIIGQGSKVVERSIAKVIEDSPELR